MKTAFLIFTLFAWIDAVAQPAETRPARPTAPSGLPASPTTPGLPASPTVPGLPTSPPGSGLTGFTNLSSLFSATNRFGTNLLPADLGPLLAELQTDLQAILPLLASVNNNFAFSGSIGSLGSTLPVTTGTGITPGTTGIGITPATAATTTGANLSGNVSADSSASLGANSGTSFAAPVGSASTTPLVPANAALSTPGSAGALNPPSPTGSTSSIGLPPGTSTASSGTNFFLTPAALNALNALIILQNDIQRMLPVVVSLNGGSLNSAFLASTNNTATGGTNRFTPTTTTPSRILSPSTAPARTSTTGRP